MVKIDIQTLQDRLCELAEVYGVKPQGQRAMTVWFDALKEFTIGDVAGLLIEWPKRGAKMPVPADVWKALNERRTEELERKAEQEKAQREADIRSLKSTAYGREMLDKLKAMVAKRPASSEQVYRQCVRRMWAMEDAGRELLPIQRDYIRRSGMTRAADGDEQLDHEARMYIYKLTHDVEMWPEMASREPGEDIGEEDAA